MSLVLTSSSYSYAQLPSSSSNCVCLIWFAIELMVLNSASRFKSFPKSIYKELTKELESKLEEFDRGGDQSVFLTTISFFIWSRLARVSMSIVY